MAKVKRVSDILNSEANRYGLLNKNQIDTIQEIVSCLKENVMGRNLEHAKNSALWLVDVLFEEGTIYEVNRGIRSGTKK